MFENAIEADPSSVPTLQVYLTQCIHALVSESQHPHKIVNLISQLVIVNNRLTMSLGN